MKGLADAASDFNVDNRIPVRRYFRSGKEMIKMAEVYRKEGNHEAAYVLYLKYITLFVEKLKKALKVRFGEEHQVWLRDEELRRVERERREAEERLRRQEIEAEIERDRQLAVKLDREERERQGGVQHPPVASIPAQLSVQQPQYDPSRYSAVTPTAPPPLYSDLTSDGGLRGLTSSPTPDFDRNSKPGPSPSSIITSATLPSVPDRGLK